MVVVQALGLDCQEAHTGQGARRRTTDPGAMGHEQVRLGEWHGITVRGLDPLSAPMLLVA